MRNMRTSEMLKVVLGLRMERKMVRKVGKRKEWRLKMRSEMVKVGMMKNRLE